jgi:hypothetical protein
MILHSTLPEGANDPRTPPYILVNFTTEYFWHRVHFLFLQYRLLREKVVKEEFCTKVEIAAKKRKERVEEGKMVFRKEGRVGEEGRGS